MSFTLDLSELQINTIMNHYHNCSIPFTNNYTLFRAKNNTSTITIFKTHTLLIQGSNCEETYLEICKLLSIEITNTPKKENTNSDLSISSSIIGSDEVGTGDFFGGITVCAAFVPMQQISKIKALGVRDSKLLSTSKVEELAPILMKEVKYSLLLLDNMKYNYLTKKQNMNLNKLKANLHNTVLKNILGKITEEYDHIIIDGFTTTQKYFEYLSGQSEIIRNKVILEEQSESRYVSVAVASIIARYHFLQHMNTLSKEVGFELPKGAGAKIEKAIEKILREKSEKYLETIAKTNFKNMTKYKKES